MTGKRFFSFIVALSQLVFNVQNICQRVLQTGKSSPVEKVLITLQQYLTQGQAALLRGNVDKRNIVVGRKEVGKNAIVIVINSLERCFLQRI